jgi:hypothetical protein
VAATKLAFTTQPVGYTSEGVLITQPVVTAQNADNSTDTAFVGVVTLTLDKASTRFYATPEPINTTHTVQAGSTASALVLSPALSFPAALPPDYNGRGYSVRIKGLVGTAWSSATAYNVGDVVTYSSVSYTCLVANTNHTPDSSLTFWSAKATLYDRRDISGNTGTTQINLATAFGAVPTTGTTVEIHSGVLPTSLAATCVTGVATFAGLSLFGWEPTALVASSPGLTSATSSTLTATGTRARYGRAELPRATVTTAAPTINGVVKTVGPTGDYPATATGLQQAMDDRVAANSALVDAIILQHGVSITGNFLMRKKLSQNGVIVIKEANDPAPEGTRAQMSTFVGGGYAKVLAATTAHAFYCDSGAHHWRLQGFEVTVSQASAFSGGMINTTDRVSETNGTGSAADFPTNIIVDRMYIHGDPTIECKFGVKLGSATSAVVDSYISDFHGTTNFTDTQGIIGGAGPGPYRVHNNYLEAGSENILFGGFDPYVAGTVPSDITITKNYLAKPMAWKSIPAISDGVKNLFELKSACRVQAEGNVMEGCWAAAQTGSAILFTPINQSGTAVNAGLRDITFRYNTLRNSSSGMNITEENSERGVLSIGLWRMEVHDNVLFNINDPLEISADHRLSSFFRSCKDVIVRHNTLLGSANASDTYALVFDTASDFSRYSLRSHYDDNLTTAQSNAVLNSSDAPGGPSITHGLLTGGGSFNNNGLIATDGNQGTGYPASTIFSATLAAAGVATPGITSTWRTAPFDDVLAALVLSGPNATAASDGTQLGADMAAVRAAIAGVWDGGASGATADHLAITTQPSGAVSGVALTTQPVVLVKDSGGSTVTSDTSTVTCTASAGITVTAGGTKAAVAGVATFSGLTLSAASTTTGTLTFSDGALTIATASITVTVPALPASKLILTTQPSGSVSGVALTQQPVVRVADSSNTTVTTDTSTVTASVLTGVGVTITAGSTKAAVAGVASFAGLTLSAATTTPGVVLRFSDGALTVADSAPFTVTGSDAPPDYGITPGAPAVYRMARGRSVFAGFRRMVRELWRWLTLSSSLA